MGIGMLRRYHARPDEGVVTETAMAPQPEGEVHPDVKAAAEAWQEASKIEVNLVEAIGRFEQEHPDDLDGDVFKALKAEHDKAFEDVELAKIAMEEVELRVKTEADAKAEQDRLDEEAKQAEANRVVPEYEKAELNRNSSTEKWKTFALANGQTDESLKGLNRDAIAVLFMGPKQ